MALTHVVMWNNGWKDITIEEAKKLHPGGTVSAKSGLFMCKLCHQNVTLTNGQKYPRYFKHERDTDQSMKCPDRSVYSAYTGSVNYHALATIPIKIVYFQSNIRIQLGLYWVDGMASDDFVSITPQANSIINNPYEYDTNKYSLSRIPEKGIKYFDVDNTPASKYILSFQKFDAKRHAFPASVQGISEEGTLFDFGTGKKLPTGADIIAFKNYYLLIKDQYLFSTYASVDIRKLSVFNNGWALYSVCATNYDKYAARFFFEYGYYLTDTPAKMIPIWPAYTETPYIINHDKYDVMYLFVQGQSIINRAFPHADLFYGYKCKSENKVLQLGCNSRQQLLSSGRDATMLRSVYLWKKSFEGSHTTPNISITDIDGEKLDKDKYDKLPRNKIICITADFDYRTVISVGDDIKSIRIGKSNTIMEIDGSLLRLGDTISLYIGNDRIRQIEFTNKSKTAEAFEDRRIIAKLNILGGKSIPVPNELRSIAARLDKNSNLRQWITAAIRKGFIKQSAYTMIVDFVAKGGSRK